MTYQELLQPLPTERLKAELQQLNEVINVFECFSTRDLIMREAILEELHNRDRNN